MSSQEKRNYAATPLYTKAEFWKCALQVNPATYSAEFRKTVLAPTPPEVDEYNKALLQIALEHNIKVLGIADHGNVDSIEAIRNVMTPHGIIVFPGFEITTTEKMHFVCLFAEETTTDELHRYLGSLGLTKPEEKVWPSNLSGLQLLQKVEELGGFAYAAHCTDENGILKQKCHHVWLNPLLKAAQIPATLDSLKNDAGNGYRQILLNKEPAYKRERPVALINAKDVEKPEDLALPTASCLIRMTTPCFLSFKEAFQDPESRVRLNSEVAEQYYSYLERVHVTGGYLNGLDIVFSKHLNAVIGGRGTGKSTLLECIRYVLEMQPIGKEAKEQHQKIIKENLGKEKALVELTIRSSHMHGKQFTLARRYGESTLVKDEEGTPSHFTPLDLLPNIEIYGQNEIFEIAKNTETQRQLLHRFLEDKHTAHEKYIYEVGQKLAENRRSILETIKRTASIEDKVALLPKLEEQVVQFKSLGIEDKLKIVPLLETEKNLLLRAQKEGPRLEQSLQAVQDNLPDTAFLSEAALEKLPHVEILRKMRTVLDALHHETKLILQNWKEQYSLFAVNFTDLERELQDLMQTDEMALEEIFKNLPACEGKSGKAIGLEFQKLVKDIETIRPQKTTLEHQHTLLQELRRQRATMLGDLSRNQAIRSAGFSEKLKTLNKKLEGKLRLTLATEADRSPIIEFISQCGLKDVGSKRLDWIKTADDFSPVKLAQVIHKGSEALQKEQWGMTPFVADALVKLNEEQTLLLEEIILDDTVAIELNTAHEGAPYFKVLTNLSTGQQCTAILHLLLLQNLDPLVMDQPEDNLDNAFIAERIVRELRNAKIARQFLFATHNANIPVFGDAEWIGVLTASEDRAAMPPDAQGAIDSPHVKAQAAEILEGGQTAFNQRKDKYGF